MMIILKIITPSTGKPVNFNELITEIPIVVKIYDMSFRLKFLVLNRRIAKIANNPIAIPNSIKNRFQHGSDEKDRYSHQEEGKQEFFLP